MAPRAISEITFDFFEKNGEFVVLNICECIGIRVPVDLSIFGYMEDCSFCCCWC
jgi:hypothetical protein